MDIENRIKKGEAKASPKNNLDWRLTNARA